MQSYPSIAVVNPLSASFERLPQSLNPKKARIINQSILSKPPSTDPEMPSNENTKLPTHAQLINDVGGYSSPCFYSPSLLEPYMVNSENMFPQSHIDLQRIAAASNPNATFSSIFLTGNNFEWENQKTLNNVNKQFGINPTGYENLYGDINGVASNVLQGLKVRDSFSGSSIDYPRYIDSTYLTYDQNSRSYYKLKDELRSVCPVGSSISSDVITSGYDYNYRDMKEKRKCDVCGDVSAGFHCSAFVCEACKKFFIRSSKGDSYSKYSCTKANNCEIVKDTRTHCQYCRFQKCLQLGMTLPGANMAQNTDISLIPCRVCGAQSSGFHFGAITCEGCKGFFRRTINERENQKYTCRNGGVCAINLATRNNCKSCRYKKCLAVGMSKEGSRIGRQPNAIKHMCAKEISQIRALSHFSAAAAAVAASASTAAASTTTTNGGAAVGGTVTSNNDGNGGNSCASSSNGGNTNNNSNSNNNNNNNNNGNNNTASIIQQRQLIGHNQHQNQHHQPIPPPSLHHHHHHHHSHPHHHHQHHQQQQQQQLSTTNNNHSISSTNNPSAAAAAAAALSLGQYLPNQLSSAIISSIGLDFNLGVSRCLPASASFSHNSPTTSLSTTIAPTSSEFYLPLDSIISGAAENINQPHSHQHQAQQHQLTSVPGHITFTVNNNNNNNNSSNNNNNNNSGSSSSSNNTVSSNTVHVNSNNSNNLTDIYSTHPSAVSSLLPDSVSSSDLAAEHLRLSSTPGPMTNQQQFHIANGRGNSNTIGGTSIYLQHVRDQQQHQQQQHVSSSCSLPNVAATKLILSSYKKELNMNELQEQHSQQNRPHNNPSYYSVITSGDVADSHHIHQQQQYGGGPTATSNYNQQQQQSPQMPQVPGTDTVVNTNSGNSSSSTNNNNNRINIIEENATASVAASTTSGSTVVVTSCHNNNQQQNPLLHPFIVQQLASTNSASNIGSMCTSPGCSGSSSSTNVNERNSGRGQNEHNANSHHPTFSIDTKFSVNMPLHKFIITVNGAANILYSFSQKANYDIDLDPNTDDGVVWAAMMDHFYAHALQVIKFAKAVPGFRDLCHNDMKVLVQEGMYPIILVQLSRDYNVSTEDYNYFNFSRHNQAVILQKFTIFHKIANHVKTSGKLIKPLNLDETIFSLICYIELVKGGTHNNADSNSIYDRVKVSEMYRYSVNALRLYMTEIGCRQPEITSVMDILPCLSRMTQEHQEAVMTLRNEKSYLKFPNLYAEMFLND